MSSVADGFDSAKENKALTLDNASGRSTKADAASGEQTTSPGRTPYSCKNSATAAFENKQKHSSRAKAQGAERVVSSSDQFRSVVLQSLLNRKLRNNGSAFASPVWRGKSSSSPSDSSVSASPARAAAAQKQHSSSESKEVANSTSKKATVLPPEAAAASTSATASKESSSPSSEESRSGPATPAEGNPSLPGSLSPGRLVAWKVQCKAADMPERMQQHALACAQQAMDHASRKPQCKRVAWLLKKEFDHAYGPAWHCIVGSSFGSYVTHSAGGFIYFSIGKFSILLFKTAVELLDQ